MRATTRAESLGSFLSELRSAAPAVIHEGRVLSFAGLDDASRRVASGLLELGVVAGDRVGIWLPNIPEWLVLYFACARVGAIAVSVNTRFRSSEVEDIVGRSGCKALALWPDFKNIDFAGILADVDPTALAALESVIVYGADDISEPVPGRRTVGFDTLLAMPVLEQDHGTPDSPCTIFTTSGTTGSPKFVVHGQAGIARHAHEAAAAHGYTAADTCVLQVLPFCGTFGLTQAMATLAAGKPMILQTVFDAKGAVELGRRYGITNFNASDEMVARMLDARPSGQLFPKLRFCGYARFAGISGLIDRAAEHGIQMRGLYGMSECQALFALQPAADPERTPKPGGLPASPDGGVRVCHPETGDVLPAGEVGEVQVTGPSLMQGYYENPGATEAAFTSDGYFRTGDMGYGTTDGGFVFETRAGDVLRLGGFLVAPAEIERYLERHPAVRMSAVVAGPRPASCVAFVALEPGGNVSEEDLTAFCLEGLAKFKVPARIHVLDELPTVPSPNGAKIRRNLLREWADEWVDKRPSA